jgi:hypothetical protein
MKSLFNSKTTAPSLVSIFPFVFLALSQVAQAVVPPPDGGYPGGNTAEGQNALLSLTTGGFNTAVGFLSLRSDTTSSFNTAVGAGTLFANTDGNNNTATGAGALFANGIGVQNTATGALALFSNTTGNTNTANGYQALFSNNTGQFNTANGFQALYSNTEGQGNTANGSSALVSNTTGVNNTALGYGAGLNITGSGNVCIGAFVQGQTGVNNTTWIRNVYDSVATTRQVYVDADDKIGTLSSSRRYKEDIKPMDKASETLFALKPVTFRYKKEIDRSHALSFGLIAEDVANISPDLITRDEEGQPQTVRYEAINAMLLNEFFKEHKTVQEQGATIAQQRKHFEAAVAQQQKEIEALTATVKKQTAQIQKVSAQIEVSRTALRTVLNKAVELREERRNSPSHRDFLRFRAAHAAESPRK